MKFLKSNYARLLQLANILPISVTLLVSKLPTSNDVRLLQPLNILYILVTLLVLLLLKEASIVEEGIMVFPLVVILAFNTTFLTESPTI